MNKQESKEYEQFIENNYMCNFTQSLKWNNIKTFWQNSQIIIKKNNEIKLAANILIRKIPFFGTLMYVPRGPIGNITDIELLTELTTKLKALAKEYKAFVILMEPDIDINNKEFLKIIKNLGYQVNSQSKNFNQEIQARHNLRLNLKNHSETEIFNNFSSKTRYNIRLAKKKGVEIKEMGIEGLKEFYNLLTITANRDNFLIRPITYYEKLMTNFKGITILLAYYNNNPIAGIMPLTYGTKTWYLYGASSNSYRNLMPNYLLQWEAIKRAIKSNSEIYDFKGFSYKKHEPDGLYRFKKGFGPELVELIGEVTLELKPFRYCLFKSSKYLFCKIRKLKNLVKY